MPNLRILNFYWANFLYHSIFFHYFKSPQIYFIKKLRLEVSPPYFKGEGKKSKFIFQIAPNLFYKKIGLEVSPPYFMEEGELKQLIYILNLNLLDQISFHSKEVCISRDFIPFTKIKIIKK